MRSRIDEKDDARRRGGKRKPAGGKALQRLLSFLAARGPKLVTELSRTLDVKPAARPRVGPARQALRVTSGRSARATRAPRVGRTPAATRQFAAAIVKAAGRLTWPKRRKPARAARTRRTGQPAPPGPSVWTELGPQLIPNGQTYGSNTVDVIGRVSCVAIDPKNPKHLLCGSAGGGIWESKDTGATWAPRTDQMPALAIGAVTFNPHDPKYAYAGSGEGNFYAALGAGLYRSTDGGTTWKVLASTPFVGVGFYDLVVDPAKPNILYAATTTGFFRSTNGGLNWTQTRAGKCWDITVHPNGGAVEVLAAFVDGLFVSTNTGGTFSSVALPSVPASWTRLAVDRVTAAPDIAYTFGATSTGAHLWRRTGTAWAKITPLPSLSVTQAWYDWYVAASPTNRGEVYLGAIDTFRGALSGASWTWKNITTQGGNSIHPDQHSLTFAPDNAKVIYAGNDGGVYRSANKGASWTALNRGLGITEIEYLGSDPNSWQWLMAGTQDNGTIRFTGPLIWDHIADGDGGDCGVSQLNPNQVYHSYYGVSLERSNNKGNTWSSLGPPNVSSLFYPPVEVSGTTVGIGATSLVITRNGAAPWTTVALGLPAGDTASAMRAVDANTFLIGTTMGRIVHASWNGTTWTVTNLTSPTPRYISCMAVDPSNPSRVWVTITQPGVGRVFRSDDGCATWNNVTAGLPNIPMNSVVVDPANFKRVWVAADVGVYETTNLGSTWTSFAAGLPNALAADLLFHKQDRMLICATRNRGAWAIHVP